MYARLSSSVSSQLLSRIKSLTYCPSALAPYRRLERFLASERGKRILNYFYSWGAAFVILGALFKLLHIRYGDEILLVSMLTEFAVFFISGFERPRDR